MSIKLSTLNEALESHGWFAEWASSADDDLRMRLYRPKGGQAHDVFEFDPSDPNDNRPWEHEIFPADDRAVDRALHELCKRCQE